MKMIGLRTIYGKNKTRKELISQIEDVSANTNILITEFDVHAWKDIQGWKPMVELSKPSELFGLMEKATNDMSKVSNIKKD